MLIDSHCHIDDPRFDADRAAMIQRARDAGIGHFVTIGCDLETSRAAVALAQKHSFISATIGVHPHEVKHIQDNWYDELRALAKSKGVVAYGEIGLDYHYDHSPREVQRARFREQVQLARELCLPIIIHTREAQEDTIAILKEAKAGAVGGGFHWFSGDAWLAKEDRKSTRLNSSHGYISYAVFCLKKKKPTSEQPAHRSTSRTARWTAHT